MPTVPPNPSDLPPGSSQKKDDSKTNQQPSTSSNQESTKPTGMDHISKGPQVPDKMPPKASKEEIEARMKELNKK